MLDPASFLGRAAAILLAGLLTGCHPGDATPTTQSAATMPTRDINTVLDDHDEELMAISGVTGVCVGLMPDQRTSCLKVLVLKKTRELQQRIPRSLEGYPVRLEESGVIRPL
jgi:hypothetical protein